MRLVYKLSKTLLFSILYDQTSALVLSTGQMLDQFSQIGSMFDVEDDLMTEQAENFAQIEIADIYYETGYEFDTLPELEE